HLGWCACCVTNRGYRCPWPSTSTAFSMNSFSLLPHRTRRTLAATVVALLGMALTAEAAGPSRVRQASARNLTRGFAGEPLASDSLRAAERAFLGKAVEVSRQQLRLAEIGVSQATNSEVR